MPDAPTTEGSIVAYLRLNDSDWNEKLDAAEAKARELSRVDPMVRVTADTAEAIAKLDAVKEAENRVGGTTTTVSRVQTVHGTDSNAAFQAAQESVLAAAYAQADAAIEKLRLAQDADNETMRQASVLGLKESLMMEALAAAERKAASAASENAAAQETESAATDKAGKSAQGGAGYTGLLAAAAIAAIPVLGSMTGAAFALGGGLTAMGGAGVLAFLGIKDEMTKADSVGVQYSGGIAQATTEITALSDTAAKSMLPAFGKSLNDIEQSMPTLNTEVSQFSALLGTGVEVTLQGVLNLFRLGNPLFVEAGQLIDNVAGGFLKWTTDGGLAKFIAYSEHELPIVMNTLGQLGGTVEHVVEAFAPLGSEVLVTVGAVSSVLNQVPLPVLLTLGTFAGAAFVAFKTWGAIAPIVDKVSTSLFGIGVAEDAAMGPVGLVAAGVTGLVAIFSAVSGAQQQATQAANDYAQALEQDNYAIGQNSIALLAKQLHDSSQLQYAHELGISTQTYTQAVLGNKDALGQVNDKIATAQQRYPSLTLASRTATQSEKDHALAAMDLKGKLDAQIGSMAAGTSEADSYRAATDAANGAVSQSVSLTDQMAAAQKKAATATDQFAQALAGLGNTNLSATQANISYQQALADADTAIAKNGATLDLNTQKGRDNTSALDNIASSAVAVIAAQAKTGTAAQDLTKNMEATRASFISTAEKMGATADQANALADQYGLIPKDVTTAFHTSGLSAAQQAAADLQAQLDAIDRNITIRVNTILTNAANPKVGFGLGNGQAGGGPVVQYRAAGGAIDSLFRPIGTDTVPTMLTPEEFVVKRSSANYDPMFLKAYNDNPAAALSAVKGTGSSDRPIYADGIGLIGWVREVAGQTARLVFNTGMNKAAQELTGGLV